MDSSEKVAQGAFGLKISGLPDRTELLLPVPIGWPELFVEYRVGPSDSGAVPVVSDTMLRATLLVGGQLELERETCRVRITTERPLPLGDIVQPSLGHAAAMLNRWLGRSPLHGSAVAIGGATLAFLGGKEAGKSSLAGWCALAPDIDVLTDDLVVVDDAMVYAGPRALDLRPAAAAALTGHPTHSSRRGERRRVTLPPCPPAVPLRGFVELVWGDQLSITPIPPGERLSLLAPHGVYGWLGGGPSALLDLARHDTWRLSRPRDWDALPDVESLLRGLCG